ncbi:MAG: hypothetical protein AABX73_00390 [Nanoarchaeota archaeon]
MGIDTQICKLDNQFNAAYDAGDFDMAEKINDQRYEAVYTLHGQAIEKRIRILEDKTLSGRIFRQYRLEEIECDIEMFRSLLKTYLSHGVEIANDKTHKEEA